MPNNLPDIIRITESELAGYGGMIVRSVAIKGSKQQLIVDSLVKPADILSLGQPSIIVYSHSDWDHCWGSGAWPGALVVGHDLCKTRLSQPETAKQLQRREQANPAAFLGSEIVLPDLTFSDSLTIDAGGFTVILQHEPGHTADSIMLYIPEHDLLIAGDSVEDPLLSINEPGHIRHWMARLRYYADAGVKQVIPSHGAAVLGPDFLRRNADYLQELWQQVANLHGQGVPLEEMQQRLPIERYVEPSANLIPYYYKTHLANIGNVLAELTGAAKNPPA